MINFKDKLFNMIIFVLLNSSTNVTPAEALPEKYPETSGCHLCGAGVQKKANLEALILDSPLSRECQIFAGGR